MTDEHKLRRYAVHEAGHVLGLYINVGNINRIDSIKIDNTGGYTSFTNEFKLYYKRPNKNTEEAHIDMFIDACYFLGGGIAVKLIFNEEMLDFDSMSEDFKSFKQIWDEELSLQNDLFKRACNFCETEFAKWVQCINKISDCLIEDMNYFQESGLGMLPMRRLSQIIEEYKPI